MHFVVGEVGVDEIVNSVGDGVECVFAVLTVAIVVVFLICDSGVRAPAPACAAFAIACVSIGSDVPGFLQVHVDFAKSFDVVLVPIVQVCRNVLAFVHCDNLSGFCSALDVGVHVIEIAKVELL